MVREIIKPTDKNINIQIPDEYINREIEFIMFPINDISTPKKRPKKSLKGAFSEYADPSKKVLEDKAWEMHVLEKFKLDD